MGFIVRNSRACGTIAGESIRHLAGNTMMALLGIASGAA
jgi:hypothetical protein